MLLTGVMYCRLVGSQLINGDGGHGEALPPYPLTLFLGLESLPDHLLLFLASGCGGCHQGFLDNND